MNRKRIQINPEEFPDVFQPILKDAAIYNSSCSPHALVLFIDKDCGYYLKRTAKGTLEREALLTKYFYKKGFATEVLSYESLEQDWLLTVRVPGEDATHADHLNDPNRLCDSMAEMLQMLHNTDTADCPVQNRMEEYLKTVEQNYKAGIFDHGHLPPDSRFTDAETAYRFAMEHAVLFKKDTLIHGDYCLPNIMLKDWKFSRFIDLGNGGVADRHIDLFWGAWSLAYNLKTEQYRDRFFDAYGRSKIDENLICAIGAMECFG